MRAMFRYLMDACKDPADVYDLWLSRWFFTLEEREMMDAKLEELSR